MMKPLGEMELPWKLLVTCFLIVLTSGFIVAELYLMHTTEMTDGKKGMTMTTSRSSFMAIAKQIS